MSAGHFTGRPADRSDDLLARLMAEARAEREPAPEPEPLTLADRMPFGADPAEVVAAPDEAGDRVRALPRPDWWNVAECRGVGTDVFFDKDPRPALELCGMCAAREPCLAEAMADPTLDFGVRGGLSANARRKRRQAERKRNSNQQTEEDA